MDVVLESSCVWKVSEILFQQCCWKGHQRTRYLLFLSSHNWHHFCFMLWLHPGKKWTMWEWEKSLVTFHLMEGELLMWNAHAPSCLSQVLTLRAPWPCPYLKKLFLEVPPSGKDLKYLDWNCGSLPGWKLWSSCFKIKNLLFLHAGPLKVNNYHLCSEEYK